MKQWGRVAPICSLSAGRKMAPTCPPTTHLLPHLAVSEPQDATNGAGGGGQRLIPQPHGGAMAPPVVKGEIRNPKGRPSKRALMAREFAEKSGLEELAELAFRVKRNRGDVAQALIDTATDRTARGHVVAQRLLWDLLGIANKEESKAALQVEVRRKVRVMDVDALQVPHGDNGHTSEDTA